jgi:hypothetical protein
MTQLNQRIIGIEIPKRMRRLKISDEGYPVPWFVPWINGKPEFRGLDGEKFNIAVRLKRCWLCGEPLGKYMNFVIGPMCAVNRTTAEPPCHRSCAEYAVSACPFLTQPRMRRNEKDLPEGRGETGIMIRRNPGVVCLWATLDYKVFKAEGGTGVLFRIGEPVELQFFTEGRKATKEELMYSIDTGLPLLAAEAERNGGDSPAMLHKQVENCMKLIEGVYP